METFGAELMPLEIVKKGVRGKGKVSVRGIDYQVEQKFY